MTSLDDFVKQAAPGVDTTKNDLEEKIGDLEARIENLDTDLDELRTKFDDHYHNISADTEYPSA